MEQLVAEQTTRRTSRTEARAPFGPAVSARALAAARRTLSTCGRVQISDALRDPDAQVLHSALEQAPWGLMLNVKQGNILLVNAERLDAMGEAGRAQLSEIAQQDPGAGYQFLYDAFMISRECDAGKDCPGPLAQFYAALNSGPWLEFFRALTSDDRVSYLDCTATRYRPGHFLTTHTDVSPVGGRLFAYVFSFTPKWRLDWGGALLFPTDGGDIAQGFRPRWNTLNVFSVPQNHAVSMVAPFARGDRLSMMGWLRDRR